MLSKIRGITLPGQRKATGETTGLYPKGPTVATGVGRPLAAFSGNFTTKHGWLCGNDQEAWLNYRLAGKAVIGRRVLLRLDTHLPAGEHMRLTISVLLTTVLAACATLPRSAGPQYSVVSRDDEAYGGTPSR